MGGTWAANIGVVRRLAVLTVFVDVPGIITIRPCFWLARDCVFDCPTDRIELQRPWCESTTRSWLSLYRPACVLTATRQGNVKPWSQISLITVGIFYIWLLFQWREIERYLLKTVKPYFRFIYIFNYYYYYVKKTFGKIKISRVYYLAISKYTCSLEITVTNTD